MKEREVVMSGKISVSIPWILAVIGGIVIGYFASTFSSPNTIKEEENSLVGRAVMALETIAREEQKENR
jgi:hypothetical protein